MFSSIISEQVTKQMCVVRPGGVHEAYPALIVQSCGQRATGERKRVQHIRLEQTKNGRSRGERLYTIKRRSVHK